MPRSAHVTAVLVSHDGAAGCPRCSTPSARRPGRPTRWVAVDTGSTDDSPPARRRPRRRRRVDAPSTPRSPSAVAIGSGPAAAARRRLDLAAARRQRAGTRRAGSPAGRGRVGPRHRRRRRQGAGVAVAAPAARGGRHHQRDRAGARPGSSRGEPDQGQHDRPRDVLAVGTAGMLVRADVWDAARRSRPRFWPRRRPRPRLAGGAGRPPGAGRAGRGRLPRRGGRHHGLRARGCRRRFAEARQTARSVAGAAGQLPPGGAAGAAGAAVPRVPAARARAGAAQGAGRGLGRAPGAGRRLRPAGRAVARAPGPSAHRDGAARDRCGTCSRRCRLPTAPVPARSPTAWPACCPAAGRRRPATGRARSRPCWRRWSCSG